MIILYFELLILIIQSLRSHYYKIFIFSQKNDLCII